MSCLYGTIWYVLYSHASDASTFKQIKLWNTSRYSLPIKQMTSTKVDFYNSPLELVSFIGGQGHTTSLGSPTMLNNDEVDFPLKTSVKV
jgi:hypothetical protein